MLDDLIEDFGYRGYISGVAALLGISEASARRSYPEEQYYERQREMEAEGVPLTRKHVGGCATCSADTHLTDDEWDALLAMQNLVGYVHYSSWHEEWVYMKRPAVAVRVFDEVMGQVDQMGRINRDRCTAARTIDAMSEADK